MSIIFISSHSHLPLHLFYCAPENNFIGKFEQSKDFTHFIKFQIENFAVIVQFNFERSLVPENNKTNAISAMDNKEKSGIIEDNDDDERRTAVSEEFNPELRDTVIGLDISSRNDRVFSTIQELFLEKFRF